MLKCMNNKRSLSWLLSFAANLYKLIISYEIQAFMDNFIIFLLFLYTHTSFIEIYFLMFFIQHVVFCLFYFI